MVKAAAAKGSKVDVGDVAMKKVNRELVTAELVKRGESKKVMESHSDEGLVSILQSKFKDLAPNELTICDKCKGSSAATLEACPYCGYAGEEAEGKAEKEKATEGGKDGKAEDRSSGSGTDRPSGMTLATERKERELDDVTKRILALKQRGALTYWETGREMASVYKDELWKFRLDPADPKKQMYKSFKQYVDREIGFSIVHAMAMIDVSRKFTEVQVGRLGASKLSIILNIPEKLKDESGKSERQRAIEEVEKGATLRELKTKVRKVREKHGVKVVEKEGRKHKLTEAEKKKHAAATSAASKKDGRMTVSMVEGSLTLELFAKPEKKLKEGEKLTKRAKNIGDEPIAIEQMANGLERVYSVLRKASGWALKIETRRTA